MIVEYIRYTVASEEAAAFEAAYEAAAVVLAADEHCLAYEVSHGIESPANYVVRIEWDSLEGHLEGFRKNPAFAAFFAAVKPFFDSIEEMAHYQPGATVLRSRA